jgi:hypothetical protein
MMENHGYLSLIWQINGFLNLGKFIERTEVKAAQRLGLREQGQSYKAPGKGNPSLKLWGEALQFSQSSDLTPWTAKPLGRHSWCCQSQGLTQDGGIRGVAKSGGGGKAWGSKPFGQGHRIKH